MRIDVRSLVVVVAVSSFCLAHPNNVSAQGCDIRGGVTQGDLELRSETCLSTNRETAIGAAYTANGAIAWKLSIKLIWRGWNDTTHTFCRPQSGYVVKDEGSRRETKKVSRVTSRMFVGCDCGGESSEFNCNGFNFVANESKMRADNDFPQYVALHTSVTRQRSGCYSSPCWFATGNNCPLTCPCPTSGFIGCNSGGSTPCDPDPACH